MKEDVKAEAGGVWACSPVPEGWSRRVALSAWKKVVLV